MVIRGPTVLTRQGLRSLSHTYPILLGTCDKNYLSAMGLGRPYY